ncbi:hypothetical protein OU995_23925 [Roseateles sp. SL47]|uniref:hypothetical protein n=1 Tax=Roseateles sp. SL47 TaxID=2995138 RepID=UPI00227203EE|nr:hypothetical protein [Roseateles sp. SL47]WAC72561.1 hypothetical protein OU995_23925 [Roseateles sp. SL47]
MVSDLSQDGRRLQLMEQGDGGANGLDRFSLPKALGGVVVRPIAELAQLVRQLCECAGTKGWHR